MSSEFFFEIRYLARSNFFKVRALIDTVEMNEVDLTKRMNKLWHILVSNLMCDIFIGSVENDPKLLHSHNSLIL